MTGLFWIFVSLLLLQFDQTSVNTIAAFVGIMLLLAAVEEFFHAILMPGWRWLHALLALLFLFVRDQCVRLLGLDVRRAGPADRLVPADPRDVRGLRVAVEPRRGSVVARPDLGDRDDRRSRSGPSAIPGAPAYLLLVWVGLGAMFRGISQIVLAFQVKKLAQEVV